MSWWFSTGVWMTANLPMSPGTFLVFWPTLKTQLFGWSPLVLLFPSLPVPLPIILATVLSVPITIVITITFIFRSFFRSLAMSRFLSLFSLSFNFTPLSTGTAKSTIQQLLFRLIISRSGRLAEMRWSVFILKSQRSLCILFYWTISRLCIYHLFVWSNFNFLHNSLWISFPTQSCLVLSNFALVCCCHLLCVWSLLLYH